jgi:hypothetical protein
MVVGHSLGGIVARLAMAPAPLDGRGAGVADDVGCLVTLGTPHRFGPGLAWRHAAVRAVEHLEHVSPGAWFAPRTGYVSVGSTMVPPARRAPLHSPLALLDRVLWSLVGETPGAPSDGLVDSARCRLDGARHVEFTDVLHGVTYGPWYGNSMAIERWWPVALEAWHAALEARRAEPAPARAA